MFNCFEKQARLDIEKDIIRENGEARLKGEVTR